MNPHHFPNQCHSSAPLKDGTGTAFFALKKTARVLLVAAGLSCGLGLTAATADAQPSRTMRYASATPEAALLWKTALRSKLADLLKISDLLESGRAIPFEPKVLSSETRAHYVFEELEISSTQERRITIALTRPLNRQGPFPAVLCVAGHKGTHVTPYKPDAGYFRMGHLLAENGYVTISTSVSRHEAYESGRTLNGERLWDLMRCVDFLKSLDLVDPERIGCAGKSLGGEMAMWLGAMDDRVSATVCAGFLTQMNQMEKDHCMCWKLPGLRELVDFADIFSLHAPRPLQCQNGFQEPPSQFPVKVAREALKEIEPAYRDLGQIEKLSFVAHEGGHVFDVPSLTAFFEKHLANRNVGTLPHFGAGAKTE
jgi:dienelactone hydrolase